MYEQIEEKLDELMEVISEKEYVEFVEKNEYVSLYDYITEFKDSEKILSEYTLKKVYNIIKRKIEYIKIQKRIKLVNSN